MKNFLVAASVGAALCQQASAFSLLGPYDTWQTTDIGYNSPFTVTSREGDAGGPMNLAEEFRWTTPFITYAFDESFVQYFGAKGVAAVESAFKVLNDLPAFSAMDDNLSGFASDTMRYSPLAVQLGLYDIKSVTLSTLLEALGLAAPERYAYSLRARDANLNIETVIQRNFDPFTFTPSARINGTLYTYQVLHYTGGADFWDAIELPVDTSNPHISVVAFANVQAGLVQGKIASPLYEQRGVYYNGLTKDDVGGLRYIYSRGNINQETPPTDVLISALSKTVSTGVADLSTALGNSYWKLISVDLVDATNATTSVTAGNGATAIGGTVVPYPYGTLISASLLGGATTGGTVTSNVFTQITSSGYRGGVDKITFANVSRYYDPLLMVTTNGYVVSYDDTVIATNGVTVKQRLGRLQPHPDILITAADIGVSPVVGFPYIYARTLATGAFFVKTSVTAGTFPNAGPGIIDPDATGNAAGAAPIEISFNKLGNYSFNFGQSSQAQGFPGFMWATFDGSTGSSPTNPPTIFPTQVDLKAYTRAIFGN